MAISTVTLANTFDFQRQRLNDVIDLVNDLGTYNLINITGGTIDGVTMGQTTPIAAANFVNIEIEGTLDIQSATIVAAPDSISGNYISGGTIDNVMVEISGTPTLSTHATSKSYVDSLSALSGLSVVGTITTGVWNGTAISGQYGGTGVNNAGKTITLGGNLITSGAFATTLTVTGATNVTLPTSGTLVNTSVATLSNLASVGTITTGVWNGTTIAIANGGTGATTASAGFDALSPMTTKGDIIARSSSAAVRRAVGANGQVLTADSSDASGLGWVTPSYPVGRQTIWVPAVAMYPTLTSGCDYGSVETTTNKIMVKTLDFDPNAIQYAQLAITMPKSWDRGNIAIQFVWSNASGTGNVIFGAQAVAAGDGDNIDVAFGTAQTVTDAASANKILRTSETSAIVIAGSPIANDTVTLQIYRNATNASDTLAVDARLHGIMIYYTIEAGNDS